MAASDIRTVQTNYKNAVDFLGYANMYLARANVLDDDGNVAQLAQIAGSPAWLFALAAGKIATEWQERLLAADNEMDINTCSDQKVLVWATIAGISRRTGSPSRLIATALNASATRDVTITEASVWQDSQTGNYWAAEANVTVSAGGTIPALVTLVALNNGAISVGTGVSLTNANFATISLSVSSCNEGSGTETISSLRNRILLGGARSDPVSRAQEEIAALRGIIKCTVQTNDSTTANRTLNGGVVLPPRTSYICIQGVDVDGKLAQTYYENMNMPTVFVEGMTTQTYTRGAQALQVYFAKASLQVCYIRLYVRAGTVAAGQDNTIKRALLLKTNMMDIGGMLTEVMIAGWLSDLSGVEIQSIDVSDNGEVWRDTLTANADKIWTWTSDTISIVER